jgi:acetyl esterase/lipase
VSAVNADLSGFPPTFVAFGSDEMLRDQIRRLVVVLEEAGVPHAAHEEHGMFHVFPILMPWASASRRVYAAVDAFIHDHAATAGAVADA